MSLPRARRCELHSISTEDREHSSNIRRTGGNGWQRQCLRRLAHLAECCLQAGWVDPDQRPRLRRYKAEAVLNAAGQVDKVSRLRIKRLMANHKGDVAIQDIV